MKEIEFNQVASKTRLSTKSREAARLVLVEGKRQVDVCQDTGILPSQLSRVLSVLGRESEKVVTSTDNVLSISRAEAVKAVRDSLGDGILVKNAPENGQSIGQVLLKTEYHLVQDLGREEVMIHELSKIDRLPAVGSNVELIYKNGFAESKQRTLEKQRDGLSR